ncbi:MAG: hypothetical protein ACYDCC_07755 [Actinomycetota bacterium]
MRRFAVITAMLLGLGVAAFHVSPAVAAAPASIDAVACLGSAGYSGGSWSFSDSQSTPLGVGFGSCAWGASEQVSTPSNPGTPPIVSGDTDPLSNVFWAIGNIPNPAPAGWSGDVNLSATGNFACGFGTLASSSSSPSIMEGSFPQTANYQLTWSATFTGGIGVVTGTAVAINPVGNQPATRSITGVMAIADGAPVACNDASPNQQAALLLILS